MIGILNTIAFIMFGVTCVFGFNMVQFSHRLDIDTRYKHDNRKGVPQKLLFLFCFFGPINYLFFKHIRKKRKENYYQYTLKSGTANIQVYRYFKLKKIKDRKNIHFLWNYG